MRTQKYTEALPCERTGIGGPLPGRNPEADSFACLLLCLLLSCETRGCQPSWPWSQVIWGPLPQAAALQWGPSCEDKLLPGDPGTGFHCWGKKVVPGSACSLPGSGDCLQPPC